MQMLNIFPLIFAMLVARLHQTRVSNVLVVKDVSMHHEAAACHVMEYMLHNNELVAGQVWDKYIKYAKMER